MNLRQAKNIVKEAYESGSEIDTPKVMDAIYYLAEFSYRMIDKKRSYAYSIKDDLVQEMVIVAYRYLKSKKFYFGCIQNFMEVTGSNYLYKYSLTNLDNTKLFLPLNTIDISELEEVMSGDKTDEYTKFLFILKLIKKLIRLAKIKLKDNLITSKAVNLYLFPVLLCVLRQDLSLIEKYSFRIKLVLKKIIKELDDELVIYEK